MMESSPERANELAPQSSLQSYNPCSLFRFNQGNSANASTGKSQHFADNSGQIDSSSKKAFNSTIENQDVKCIDFESSFNDSFCG